MKLSMKTLLPREDVYLVSDNQIHLQFMPCSKYLTEAIQYNCVIKIELQTNELKRQTKDALFKKWQYMFYV